MPALQETDPSDGILGGLRGSDASLPPTASPKVAESPALAPPPAPQGMGVPNNLLPAPCPAARGGPRVQRSRAMARALLAEVLGGRQPSWDAAPAGAGCQVRSRARILLRTELFLPAAAVGRPHMGTAPVP